MKLLLATLLALFGLACSGFGRDNLYHIHTAYGYLEKVAIPEAERLRKAEEANFNKQKIVGGTPASPGQYPYQAGLILSITGLSDIGVCGGTILNQNRILTAAHCWYDGVHEAWKVTVIFGSLTLFSEGDRRESTKVVVHPNWDPAIVRNDIGIIYLPTSVEFSVYISPVSLPSDDELDEDFVGYTTIASGFGLTNDDSSSNTGLSLNHVPLVVIPNDICSFVFPFLIQPSNICTLGYKSGVCRGDSGGPLVVQKQGRSILIGVTSFGSTLGCQAGLPNVYTRVTSFMKFIKDNL